MRYRQLNYKSRMKLQGAFHCRGCYSYRAWSVFCFFLFHCLSSFHFWSMCIPSTKKQTKQCQNKCWVHGKCSYTESVRGSEGVLTGWRGKKDGNRVVCGFILSSITPITDEYLLSTLFEMLRMQVAHWGKHLLISPWPSTYLPSHLFISSSDDNPPCPFLYSSASPPSSR